MYGTSRIEIFSDRCQRGKYYESRRIASSYAADTFPAAQAIGGRLRRDVVLSDEPSYCSDGRRNAVSSSGSGNPGFDGKDKGGILQ